MIPRQVRTSGGKGERWFSARRAYGAAHAVRSRGHFRRRAGDGDPLGEGRQAHLCSRATGRQWRVVLRGVPSTGPDQRPAHRRSWRCTADLGRLPHLSLTRLRVAGTGDRPAPRKPDGSARFARRRPGRAPTTGAQATARASGTRSSDHTGHPTIPQPPRPVSRRPARPGRSIGQVAAKCARHEGEPHRPGRVARLLAPDPREET